MDEEKAISVARMTKGFAYAYQVMGSAFFSYKDQYSMMTESGGYFCMKCGELPEGVRYMKSWERTGN